MSSAFNDLLDFQRQAVQHMYEGYRAYEPSMNLYTKSAELPYIKPGEPKPYLHRLKAVTGSGKTPILAKLGGLLNPSIILWTTPKSAVINQTKQNLEGKYKCLLPANTEVYELSNLSPADWDAVLSRQDGLTILVTTVASFNEKGNRLKLHRKDDQDISIWEQMKPIEQGGSRQRNLFVFYDEGHNATTNQFARLLELRPASLFLASASSPFNDLHLLLPGESPRDKELIFNEERTTRVNTSSVVAANLLKEGIEIISLETDWKEIIKEANTKLQYLQQLLPNELLIGCFIVDRTEKGIDIWHELRQQGIPGDKIAVHLSKATSFAKKKFDGTVPLDFHDTYNEELTPEDLRSKQYTYLIWNLSLKEGWDEPWAYVAYIHDKQASTTDIEQKIGRFVRNPFKDSSGQPSPPEHPDLGKSYFYFNCDNKVFHKVLQELQEHLQMEGFDALRVEHRDESRVAEEVPPKMKISIPLLAVYPNTEAISKLLLEKIPTPHADECGAPGIGRTGTMNMGNFNIETEERTLQRAPHATSGQIIKSYLELHDSRLIKATGSFGGWLSDDVWNAPQMRVEVCFGSKAYNMLHNACQGFCNDVDKFLELDTDISESFEVSAFKMNNPNGGDTATSKKSHKVHHFSNSVHPRYNGLNDFEFDFAQALDKSNRTWARNPARTGYGIPLLRPSANSKYFYPDFILWDEGRVVFLETKGRHLLKDSITDKLISLSGISHAPKKCKIYFVVDKGLEVIEPTQGIVRENNAAYTLLHRDTRAQLRSHNFQNLPDLIRTILA